MARRAGVTKGALYHHFGDKRGLFETVVAKRVRHIGKTVAWLSAEAVPQRGGRSHGWDRVAAGVGPLLDELGHPDTRQIVLIDGPAVLGRERWDEVWIESSLLLVRRALGPGEGAVGVAPQRIDPLARFLLGGLQEAAHWIGRGGRSEAIREQFADAILWALWALHRQANEDARRHEAEDPPGAIS